MSEVFDEPIDDFQRGLEEWVNSSPYAFSGERSIRILAAIRIDEVRRSGDTYLSLNGSTSFEQTGFVILKSLPRELWTLTNLRQLDLGNLHLGNISEEIRNLTALTDLSLGNNRLTTVPELTGLTALRRLDLSGNPLSVDAINSVTRSLPALRNLRLDRERLRDAPEQTINIAGNVVSLGDDDHPVVTTAAVGGVVLDFDSSSLFARPIERQDDLITTILSVALEEEGEKLQTFLESLNGDFGRFLVECPRTEAWKSHRDQMTKCLFEIVKKMSESEVVKTKCEAIATTAFGSCGDRAALAFVQMQLSLNLSDKKLEEMNVVEVYDYAKQESVIKYLAEKSEDKVEQLKDAKRPFDEIETHLAYLQIGQDLGLNMKALGMLYKKSSNVTETELEAAKKEFLVLDRERQIAKHIYTDAALNRHPFVQEIIGKVAARKEFLNTDPKEGEGSAAYNKRVKTLAVVLEEAVISEIQNTIKNAIKKDKKEQRQGFANGLREKIREAKMDEENRKFSFDHQPKYQSRDPHILTREHTSHLTPAGVDLRPSVAQHGDVRPSTEMKKRSGNKLRVTKDITNNRGERD